MTNADHNQTALPAMTWAELEVLIADQAATPLQRRMVHYLVDGLQRQARFLTPGGMLREIAIITLAATDQLGGEDSMPASH